MGDALRVGLVGTGQISGAYLRTLPQLPGLVLTKVADLDADRARATAAQAPGRYLSRPTSCSRRTTSIWCST